MGDTLEDLGRAPEAEVNLVVSFCGTLGGQSITGEVRDTLCDRDTDPGIYEESFECNRRKKQVAYLEKGRRISLTGNKSEKVQKTRLY